jgi:hypothetical protein
MHFREEKLKIMIISTIALNPISSSVFIGTAEYDSAIVKVRKASVYRTKHTA